MWDTLTGLAPFTPPTVHERKSFTVELFVSLPKNDTFTSYDWSYRRPYRPGGRRGKGVDGVVEGDGVVGWYPSTRLLRETSVGRRGAEKSFMRKKVEERVLNETLMSIYGGFLLLYKNFNLTLSGISEISWFTAKKWFDVSKEKTRKRSFSQCF